MRTIKKYKRILISEEQLKRICLKEAIQDEDFSLKILTSCNDCHSRIRYCNNCLGPCIGHGIDRWVYDLSDNYVLKITTEKNGNESQNYTECLVWEKSGRSPFLPRIVAHADDYSWLVSEKIIPVTEEDFLKVLGMPWRSRNEYDDEYDDEMEENFEDYPNGNPISTPFNIADFIDFCEGWMDEDNEPLYEKAISKDGWFKGIYEFIRKMGICDLHRGNFGMVNRDGHPMIVICDAGYIDQKVFNEINR